MCVKAIPSAFSVDAYPDVEFSGVVNQVRLASVELNNVVTYTVIITADNPQLKLLPGMTAIVEIVTGASEDVLRVSNDALRFTPPADSELASAAASNTGDASSRGPGGGRILQDLNRMAGDLGLNADQVSTIEKGLQEVMAEMRPQMQGGGGPDGSMDAMREQMRRKIAEVFRDNLSADQYRQYEAMRSQRQSMRSGQLWVQDEDGEYQAGQRAPGHQRRPVHPVVRTRHRRGHPGGDQDARAAELMGRRSELKR